MLNARSQERLIGGKKPTLTITHQPAMLHQQQQMIPMQTMLQQQQQKPLLQQTMSHPHNVGGQQPQALMVQLQQELQQQHSVGEKQKRNVMKTQATQTEVYQGRRQPIASVSSSTTSHNLSLSPRTQHRVSTQ